MLSKMKHRLALRGRSGGGGQRHTMSDLAREPVAAELREVSVIWSMRVGDDRSNARNRCCYTASCHFGVHSGQVETDKAAGQAVLDP